MSDYEDVRAGTYTDVYFNNTVEILNDHGDAPHVLMQLFNKTGGIVCGIKESLHFLRESVKDKDEAITIKALKDGDAFEPFETILTIEGKLNNFAHLETVILGIISRATKVATNTRKVVEAANGKPILFFAARFDRFENQAADGYAAKVGGVSAVSTEAQATTWDKEATGTMPHALLAVYNGDCAVATTKFTDTFPDKKSIALVDFRNDCVGDAIATAVAMRARGRKLYGVRLDTGGMMVDKSVVPEMGAFKPTGVCPQLVHNVRKELDSYGFKDVRIYVSGGFTVDKINMFERLGVPVDGYGVGSSLLRGNYDFTADVVKPHAKTGRKFRPNDRLEVK